MEIEFQRLQEELEIQDQTIAMMRQQANSIQQARMPIQVDSETIQSQFESTYTSSKPTNTSEKKTAVGKESRGTQPDPASCRLPTCTKQPTLTWRKESELPQGIWRGPDVVIRGNMAYFMDKYGASLSYDFSTEKWKTLPKSNYSSCGLAIVEDQLNTIGGCDWDPNMLYTVFRRKEYKVTKKLLTLQSNKWMECLGHLYQLSEVMWLP